MLLIPKNWINFQHYKDRSPPWIKLHKGLLDDRLFQRLPDASRALAPCLWLLASESKSGEFDGSTQELSFRVRQSEKWVAAALEPLISNGFFIVVHNASDVLAEHLQVAVPETEGETEIEQIGRAKRRMQIPDNFTPNETGIECARAKGISVDVELPKFTDFHKAKGSVMLDWQAAFRTWIGNARTFNRGADVAAVTVPAKPGIDPALAKIEADAKKAAPMPAEVRELASRLKTKTLTADTARAF